MRILNYEDHYNQTRGHCDRNIMIMFDTIAKQYALHVYDYSASPNGAHTKKTFRSEKEAYESFLDLIAGN